MVLYIELIHIFIKNKASNLFSIEDVPELIIAWQRGTAGILFGSVCIGTLLYCSSGYITTHRLINVRPLTMETVSTKGHT